MLYLNSLSDAITCENQYEINLINYCKNSQSIISLNKQISLFNEKYLIKGMDNEFILCFNKSNKKIIKIQLQFLLTKLKMD